MAKVYDSPTANLFALLADETDRTEKKNAKAASKGKEQEMTPKERAEAKAVQDAERRAKREAEKAKKEAEAARKKDVELTTVDNTGFTQQRHQKIKEGRLEKRAPTETSPKPNKNEKAKGPKNKGQSVKANQDKTVVSSPKADRPQKGGKPADARPKGEGKTFNKDRPDKQSQGAISRKPGATKGGHGRGNWDTAGAKTYPAGTTAEEAANSPSLAAKEDTWEDVPDSTPVAEGEAKPDAPVEENKEEVEGEEEEEEDNELTLDEYLLLQEEKKKELEAVVGVAVAQPRSLNAEESKALSNYTRLENTKVPKKPEAKAASASPATRKAAKQPVVLEINVAHPPRTGQRERRGPREGGNRGGNRDQNRDQQKKGGRAAKPAKLPRGTNFDAQFPSLG